MKSSVSLSDFIQAFRDMGRDKNFSYDGLEKLFEYLKELEEETGQELELDVIAICCDYNEYENLKEFQQDYGEEYKSIEDIQEQTDVIMIDDERFIIRVF